MFRNFFIIAIRNFRRNKFFTLINILGLALGMSISLLMLEYIFHELSYDRFHENKDDIFRVIVNQEKGGEYSATAYITAAVAPSMAEEFPEVKHFVRFANPVNAFFSIDNRNYPVENLTYADSSLFDVFSFKLLKGDAGKVLSEPYQVVLTESTAHMVFGEEDPVGRVVRLNGKDNLMVIGIMEDFPTNSHLRFGAVVSFSTLYLDKTLFLDWNGGWNYFAYVHLYPNADLAKFRQKFPEFMEKNINYLYRQHGFILHLDLQPLARIHLFSAGETGIEEAGNLDNVYIFSSIAIFILLIACINFMNLTTARSLGRAREIGLRKVAGASRPVIILQFLFETMILSAAAFATSLVLVDIFQGEFNRLLDSDLSIFGPSALAMLGGMAVLVLLTGILAGSYPAWFMSRFQPLLSIKGTMISGKGKSVLRNMLVVFQFVTSLVLITLSLVIYKQMQFIRSKPMGYDSQNAIVVPLVGDNAMKNHPAIRNAFLEIPEVTGVGASSDIPGSGFTMNGYLPEGLKEPMMIHVIDVDENYTGIMGIPVIEGRGFDPGPDADKTAFLINKTLARELGWDNPIGKKIYRDGEHKIIGVVDDFHFASLHQRIEPLIFTKEPWIGYNFLTVKIQPGSEENTIKKLETAWSGVIPQEPFSSFSHSDYVRSVYASDRVTGETILWFSLLAIFIACLGLLGLASYTFHQRRKEIGIRKVLGASESQVAISVTFSFLRLVLIASLIAVPLAWWLSGRWLDAFAFKAFPGPFIFFLPVIFVAGLAWLTIYFQVRRLASTNPSEVIKFD